MNISSFQTEFNKIMGRDYFTNHVKPIREQAFNNFLEEGLPNKNWEDWRFTDLKPIKENNFRISEIGDAPTQSIEINEYGLNDLPTIVIYNGHYQESMSSIPNGLRLISLSEYGEQKGWRFNEPKDSPFDLLNTAFMDSGFCLSVDKGVQVESPIRILFISSSENKIMVSPRVYIELEESSSVTFVEQHEGNSKEYLLNSSLIMGIKRNSRMCHIRIQNNSGNTFNIGNIHVQQDKESHYSFYQFAYGSKIGRLNLFTNLNGKGAECFLNGLALTCDHQHLDNHIITNHNAPNCTSSQNFKSLLNDSSSGVFNGRTIVSKGAEKTDSNQSNKNILLSKGSLMNSNPQLEIYADDVKCSHGSTTGALDRDAIFYIQSRGIDMTSAKALLVRGFVSEMIESISHKYIKQYVISKFDSWLNENTI
tara:strand:+ start:2541 stop:3806 length:1266 start_codon:yes stop_codon:yes gene_type:complete